MTTSSEARSTSHEQSAHDWHEAGAAWGHAANEWSCLFEHYSLDVVLAIFGELGVRPGLEMLEMACGSGLAMRLAQALGANVAAIDASADLVEIARSRVPDADVRLGSMFELPWPDKSFDAVVSINGVWGGCESALHEAFRVLRPGGPIGISFWGMGPPLDLRAVFKAMAAHAPDQHFESMKRLNNIAAPGVAEDMLRTSGFDVIHAGQRISTIEWPDAEVAWRALSSIGPAVPAIADGKVEALKRSVLAAIEPCRDSRGIYRFRNEQRFVIGRRPA